MRDKPLGVLIFITLAGFVFGSVLGQVIGSLLPDSTPKSFLLSSYSPGFGFGDAPVLIDFYVIKIKMGVQFTFNIIGLVGVAISVYLFRWYK